MIKLLNRTSTRRLSRASPLASATNEQRRTDAVYVAGNSGIFFPALVALTSVEAHNPGRFDLYMIFDGADLTQEMAATLDRYGVKFISAPDVPAYEQVLKMTPMRGKWPVEIFLNWAMPEHLGRMGYRYAFKADYDLLCVSPWIDIDAFLPTKCVLSALRTRNGRSVIPALGAARVADELGVDCSHPHSINAGFVIFNTKSALEVGFFERFSQIYGLLVESAPDVALLEQVVVAIVGHKTGGIVRLHKRYNQRTRSLPTIEEGKPIVRNIHYLSKWKPWLPHPDIEAALARRNWCILPFYRGLWLEHAANLDGFEEFTDQRPFTPTEVLAVASRALSHTVLASRAAIPKA